MTIAHGIHSGISREEYDALDRLNFSRLKLMAKSAAHFKAWPDKDTASKKTGRAVHLAVLEPDRYDSAVAVWTGKVRNGKAWDAFKEEHAGKELLSVEEDRQCRAIAEAVRSHPGAKRYIDGTGTTETTLLWNHSGFDCKVRLDLLRPDAVVELKTTKDASRYAFEKQSYSLGYHVQGAWQSDALALLTGEALPFVIVAVEPEEPYCVVVYCVPPPLLANGRNTYARWMQMLADAQAADRWPGYADEEIELQLPAWAEQESA